MQTYFDEHCHNLFGSVFSILFISLLGYKPFRLYIKQGLISGSLRYLDSFVRGFTFIYNFTRNCYVIMKKKPIVVKFTNIRKVSMLNEETGLPPK